MIVLHQILIYRSVLSLQFRLCITNTKASGKAHTPIRYITNQQRKQELYSDFVGVILLQSNSDIKAYGFSDILFAI